jgi:hypothetical protein
LRLVLATLSSLVALELGLSLGGARAGMFYGQPLPPFGSITNPAQAAWLHRALAEGGDGGGISVWDTELGWVMAPGRRTEDGQETINSAGMRGPRDYASVRPAGTLRLSAYGDSFTFGDEVADESAYPHLLEQQAAERGQKLEAFNFGLPGGGTDQAWLRYRREREAWPTEVVAIGILLENIGRNVNRYRPRWTPYTTGPSVKPRFVLEDDGELRLVPIPVYADRSEYALAVRDGTVWRATREDDYWHDRPGLGVFQHLAIARVLGVLLAHHERQPRSLWLDSEGEAYRTSLAILEGFHREALADGATAAPVVLFPDADDLRELRDTGQRYWQGLVDDLEGRGVPVIDLSDALLERSRSLEPGKDLVGVYVSRKGHLAHAGNEVVAREVLDWIEDRGLFESDPR